MTISNAVDVRRSRRKYDPEPIDPGIVNDLQKLIAQCGEKEGLNIQLVLDNGKAFSGIRRSYGMFSGVTNYLGLISNKSIKDCNEKLGYYGELIVLHATTLGLGTCWVGGTFDRDSCPFTLSPDEKIACVIAIGNVSENLSFKENLIRGLTHRGTKAIEKLYKADGEVPDWFVNGMKAVQKAPSAVNRQSVMFTYKAETGEVSASVENIEDASLAIDLGIAKLHFTIGSGNGVWDFGNGGKFVPEKT